LPRDGEDRRRVLRAKYRELRKEIVHGRVGTGTESGYNSGRDVNNKLFQRVHHTRELVLDAENIDAIVDLYRDQADALLQVGVARLVVYPIFQYGHIYLKNPSSLQPHRARVTTPSVS
jgi:hypothetical protein